MTSVASPPPGAPAGGSNRRRFPRYEVALSVIMRRPGGEVLLFTGDVSRHGAFLRTHEAMPLSQVVQLRFIIPQHGPMDAMCTVARVLSGQVPQGPGLGVDFFALSKDAKALWERFIADLKNGVPVAPPTLVGTLATIVSPPAPVQPAPPASIPPVVVGTSVASQPPGYAPPGYAPSGYAPSGYAPSGYAPSGYAPPGYAPPAYGSHEHAPAAPAPSGYAPPAAPPAPSAMSSVVSPAEARALPLATVSLVPTPFDAIDANVEDAPLAPLDGNVLFLKFPHVEALEIFQREQFTGEGVFIQTPFVKEVGDTVEVVLIHPDSDEEFRLEGTVVRRVLSGPPQERGLGVYFRSRGPEVFAQLREFVDSGAPVLDLVQEVSTQLAALEAQVRREPDNAALLEELGRHHLDAGGDVGQALACLTRAVILAPGAEPVHAALALAYQRVGDGARSAAHAQIAAALAALALRGSPEPPREPGAGG